VQDIRVWADTEKRRLHLRLSLANRYQLSGREKIKVAIRPKNHKGSSKTHLFEVAAVIKDTVAVMEIPLEKNIRFWSEYDPALYEVSVSLLSGGALLDQRSITTGFRTFQPAGTHFYINGRVAFLRGKNESCVFPLTGYPPTRVEE